MATSKIIGPFEVLERLGAGGMGEVFKARDRRLNRSVAIKFLPEAASATARERFQREALAIAALNHPNICTLHEAGEHEGRAYLVMELLEGETLHDRLVRRPIPLAQIAQWGGEIADALQTAHAKGILHRDLKPGNIFVTQRGTIKVLDFGLAQFAAGPESDANAATVTGVAGAGLPPLTHPGMTLGTYAYMSPEQARGEPSDARSDIFSLGVVLYEMAGGQPPFRGRTSADLMAAILMLAPPPPSTLRPEVAGRLDDVIAQCLEKDPELRFQSAADLRVALRRLQSVAPSSSSMATVAAAAVAPNLAPPSAIGVPTAKSPRRLWWAAAVVVVAAGAGLWWKYRAQPALPAALQVRQMTYSGQVQDAAISPDGKFLAYVANGPQGASLHLMSVANGGDTQIMPPVTGCCIAPSFSPDGTTVYFEVNRQLKAIPVLGGAVRTLADNVCSGAGVSPDGSRIAWLAPTTGTDVLWIAKADGTAARKLSDPTPAGYNSQCWLGGPLEPDTPAWSPDGQWIAVERSGAGAKATVQVNLVNAGNAQVRPLGPQRDISSSGLAWQPDGKGLLMTVRMPSTGPSQLWKLTYPEGKMVQLTHDLQGYDRVTLAPQADGMMALIHSNPEYSIWTQAKPGGAFDAIPGGGASQDGRWGLAWTPEGRIVSLRSFGDKSQIWLEGGGTTPEMLPITNLPTVIQLPIVAPNGQIVFQGINAFEDWRTLRVNADGNGLTDLAPGQAAWEPAVTSDGKLVVYLRTFAAGNSNHRRLWVVPLAGGTPRELWPHDIYINFVLATPDQGHVLVIAKNAGSVIGTVTSVPVDGAPPIAMKPREYHARFGGPYGVTPDGRALTSVINAGSVDNVWAAPLDGGPLYQITHFTDLNIAAYAFAKDGRLAVSRGSQNSDAVLATGLVNHGH